MEQEKSSPQDVKDEITPAEGVNETAITEDVKNESSIPYARFKEVLDKDKEKGHRIAELESKLKADEENKLIEEGKKDELIARLTSERDSLSTSNEKMSLSLQQVEDARREELLSRLPEDKREKYSKYQLDVLEDITSDLAVHRANVQVDESRASSRGGVIEPFSAKNKDKDSQRKSWKDRLNSYR